MNKHLLLLSSLFLLSLCGFSQANLVIFAEDGDAFYAYVNGIKQNSNPETNVKVTGLSPTTAIRIEFADKNLPQLKQNMYMEAGQEYAVRIKRNAKKELKLRMFGQTPIADATSSGATTVAYHTSDDNGATSTYNTAGTGISPASQPATMDGNVAVNSSTTTSVTKGTGDQSVNINMSGTGISMNVSGMDNGGMNTTTSTTVTKSSSTSGSSYASDDSGISPTPNTATSHNNTHYSKESHHAGCAAAMLPANFEKMKQAVAAKPFSDTKMSTAKVATKNACLSSSQIKQICKLFSMDDDKLAYAEYAYDYCVDKANFYTVSEVFSFSTTTDALNKFLEGH